MCVSGVSATIALVNLIRGQNKIIMNCKQKGFTIVELLIVIVVIGILAAISIVAYSTITARANAATAASAAKAVKDVAENYKGANSKYPNSRALFLSGGTEAIAKLPSDINFVSSLTAASKTKDVKVTPRAASATATDNFTGFTICSYDYNNTETGDEVCIKTGDVTNGVDLAPLS